MVKYSTILKQWLYFYQSVLSSTWISENFCFIPLNYILPSVPREKE